MKGQERHQFATATGAPGAGGSAFRQKGDAEFEAATWALCNASDDAFFVRSPHPHPVHVRNVGLFSAWKQWPAVHFPIGDRSLAIQTIDPSFAFSENEVTFRRLFHRCRKAGYAVPSDLDGRLQGMSTLATAASMYWLRPHALIEPTSALDQLLAASDLGADIPVSQLRSPLPSCFIRFGNAMQPALRFPGEVHAGQRLTGAYVFETQCDGKREIVIVSIFEYADDRLPGVAITNMVIDDENISLLDALAAISVDPQIGEMLRSQQLAIAQACTKVFLYWSIAHARRVEEVPYSVAMARLRAVGPKKAARLRWQVADLYDRVVLGPIALPVHLDCSRGDVAPHWRRGHFRMQAHGPQSSLRKVIFIAPTLVRADRLADSAAATHQKVAKHGKQRTADTTASALSNEGDQIHGGAI